MLEGAGIEVFLVNARHVKGVPGKKTDVRDAQWLHEAWSVRAEQKRHKMGQYTRRIKGRLGKAEGLTAGAHKLSRIIYGMIVNQTEYNEEEAFKTTPSSLARQRKNLEKQAIALGLQLPPLV